MWQSGVHRVVWLSGWMPGEVCKHHGDNRGLRVTAQAHGGQGRPGQGPCSAAAWFTLHWLCSAGSHSLSRVAPLTSDL